MMTAAPTMRSWRFRRQRRGGRRHAAGARQRTAADGALQAGRSRRDDGGSAGRGGRPQPVGAVAALAKMRDEGIVTFRREGQTLWYRIADPAHRTTDRGAAPTVLPRAPDPEPNQGSSTMSLRNLRRPGKRTDRRRRSAGRYPRSRRTCPERIAGARLRRCRDWSALDVGTDAPRDFPLPIGRPHRRPCGPPRRGPPTPRPIILEAASMPGRTPACRLSTTAPADRDDAAGADHRRLAGADRRCARRVRPSRLLRLSGFVGAGLVSPA